MGLTSSNFEVLMILSLEMDMATQDPILNEVVCISHKTNTLGKGMNPTILPLAMDK